MKSASDAICARTRIYKERGVGEKREKKRVRTLMGPDWMKMGRAARDAGVGVEDAMTAVVEGAGDDEDGGAGRGL